MNTLWSSGNYLTLTGASVSLDPCFEGFAQDRGRCFTWQAFPKPNGYLVAISAVGGGYLGEFQGSTLNLALEVNAALRRLT